MTSKQMVRLAALIDDPETRGCADCRTGGWTIEGVTQQIIKQKEVFIVIAQCRTGRHLDAFLFTMEELKEI